MKVLMITSSFPTHPGDYAGIFIFELAQSLVTLGLQVTVVTPHCPASKLHEWMNGVEVIRFRYWWPTIHQKVAHDGGLMTNVKKSWLARIQFPAYLIASWAAALRLARQADLIHVQWLPNIFPALIAKILWKKSIVVTLHGSDIPLLTRGWFSQHFWLWIWQGVDLAITASTLSAETLKTGGFTQRRIITIPYGLPSAEQFLSIPIQSSFNFQLLTIGRLVSVKNHSLLIQAVGMLRQRWPAIHLTIIGEGPLRPKLTSHIAQLGLESTVTLAGEQVYDQLPKYFAAADIFVLASDTEGFGLVLLEAMAAGLPTVTTKVGASADIIQTGVNGQVVPPRDADALAQAIQRYITDDSFRQRASRLGRQTVQEKFRWPKIAAQTHHIYQELLNHV